MDGLSKTIKNNIKTKMNISDSSEINESQMLWMLWRHLRNTSRLRASNMFNVRDFLQSSSPIYSDSNSSGSDSPSNSDGSDDDFDRAPNCNTS
jgi:hypothetical protein